MDQLHINIRLKYVTLLSGVLITAAVVGFFWYKAQPVNVLFSAIAAGTAITALVYTAINSQFTSQVYVEQLRVKKLENAMTFIEYSTSPEMVQAVDTGVALREEIKGKSPAEVKQLLANSPDKKKALIMIFNYFERLGVIVKLGAADEEALRHYYHAAVKRYWHSFRPWVEDMRNELQDAALFSETEYLVHRWD
jgi:hypothetical protein